MLYFIMNDKINGIDFILGRLSLFFTSIANLFISWIKKSVNGSLAF